MTENISIEWANAKCRYSVWAGTIPEWAEHAPATWQNINRLIGLAEAERTFVMEGLDEQRAERR